MSTDTSTGPAVPPVVERALQVEEAADPFRLAGQEFTSRLLLGTGGVPSLDLLQRAIEVVLAEVHAHGAGQPGQRRFEGDALDQPV